MVVLDAVHDIQRTQAGDLAVRWNCKAAKCGSCGAEVNGKPRADVQDAARPTCPRTARSRVGPLRAFPIIRDLVTDVSWNYEVNKQIPPFTPKPDANWLMQQEDVDRIEEFRKCIECFLCQDVCHVLRDHQLKSRYFGPRFFVRIASLEMHPLDDGRPHRARSKDDAGLGALQHHEVLHRGLPRGDPHHRQRDHPAEGARRRPALRPAVRARAQAAPQAGLIEPRASGTHAQRAALGSRVILDGRFTIPASMSSRLPAVAAGIALLATPAAFASSSPVAGYVPLDVRPDISLHAGQRRTFSAAAAPTGTVVACLNRGVRAELRVPPLTEHGLRAFSAIAFKKGGASAQIHITRRSLNSVAVTCTP